MKKEKISKHSYVFVRILAFLIGWIFKIIYRYRVVNGGALPSRGAYLLVSNHISNADAVLMVIVQRKRALHFMAKSELFKNRLFGFILRKLGAFPVVRGAGDETAINTGKELLRQGQAEVIYFEGTRSKTGEFLRPKTGAAMIAFATNTPIIPVCVTHIGKGWLRARYVMHFGEPLTPAELGLTVGNSAEFRAASRKIMGILAEFRKEDVERFSK